MNEKELIEDLLQALRDAVECMEMYDEEDMTSYETAKVSIEKAESFLKGMK